MKLTLKIRRAAEKNFIKTTAAAVAAIFTFSTIAAPVAEANFWRDRQKSVEKKSASDQSFVAQLAELPNAERVTQGLSHLNQLPAVDVSFQGSKGPDAVKIPSALQRIVSFGDIQKIKLSKNPNSPLVVLIQDAHGVYSAQNSIANILKQMDQNSPLLVGTEGAAGAYRLSAFRGLSDKKAAKTAHEFLFQTGLINGPEFFGLTADREPLMWGMETPDLYRKNVEAYRNGVDRLIEAEKALALLQTALTSIHGRVLTPELRDLNSRIGQYSEGKTGLAPFLTFLSQKPGYQASRFPHMNRFVQALSMEKDMNFGQVQSERSEILKNLTNRLPEAQMSRLVQASLAYRTGHLSHGAFYVYLKDTLASAKISLDKYPAFACYLNYVQVADKIEPSALFDEIEGAKAAVTAGLVKTADQAAAMKLADSLRWIEKLIRHEFTSDEWRSYAQEKGGIQSLPKTLMALAAKTGASVNKAELSGLDLAAVLSAFEDFYIAASQRDAALSENFEKKLSELTTADGRAPPLAVMITGGFHTPSLEKEMEKRGFSFATVTPKITDIPENAGAYLQAFSRTPTSLDKILLGEKLMMDPEGPLANPMTDVGQTAAERVKYGAPPIYTESSENREKAAAEIGKVLGIAVRALGNGLVQVGDAFFRVVRDVLFKATEPFLSADTSVGRVALYRVQAMAPSSWYSRFLPGKKFLVSMLTTVGGTFGIVKLAGAADVSPVGSAYAENAVLNTAQMIPSGMPLWAWVIVAVVVVIVVVPAIKRILRYVDSLPPSEPSYSGTVTSPFGETESQRLVRKMREEMRLPAIGDGPVTTHRGEGKASGKQWELPSLETVYENVIPFIRETVPSRQFAWAHVLSPRRTHQDVGSQERYTRDDDFNKLVLETLSQWRVSSKPTKETLTFLQDIIMREENRGVRILLVKADVLGNHMARYFDKDSGVPIIAVDERFFDHAVRFAPKSNKELARAGQRVFIERLIHELSHDNKINSLESEIDEEASVIESDYRFWLSMRERDRAGVRLFLKASGYAQTYVAANEKYSTFARFEESYKEYKAQARGRSQKPMDFDRYRRKKIRELAIKVIDPSHRGFRAGKAAGTGAQARPALSRESTEEDFEDAVRDSFAPGNMPFVTGVKSVKVVKTYKSGKGPVRSYEANPELFHPNAMAAIEALRWLSNKGDRFVKAMADFRSAVRFTDYVNGGVHIRGRQAIQEAGRDGDKGDITGQKLGAGYVGEDWSDQEPDTDTSLDSVEITNGLVSDDFENTVSVASYGTYGSLLFAPDLYLSKWVVGPAAAGKGVSVRKSVKDNLQLISDGTDKSVAELKGMLLLRGSHMRRITDLVDAGMSIGQESDDSTVLLMKALDAFRAYDADRKDGIKKKALEEAYKALEEAVKKTGILWFGNLCLASDGDLMPAMDLLTKVNGIDFVTGRGGAPEGAMVATQVKSFGGEISAEFVSYERLQEANLLADLDTDGKKFSDDELANLGKFGFENPGEIEFKTEDLVKGSNHVHIAAGIKQNVWIPELKPVRFDPKTGEITVSVLRVASSGDVRVVDITYTTGIDQIRLDLAMETDPTNIAWLQLHLALTLSQFGQYGLALDALEKAQGLLNDESPAVLRADISTALHHTRAMKALIEGTTEGSALARMAVAENELRAAIESNKGGNSPTQPEELLSNLYEHQGDQALGSQKGKKWYEARALSARAVEFYARAIALLKTVGEDLVAKLMGAALDTMDVRNDRLETIAKKLMHPEKGVLAADTSKGSNHTYDREKIRWQVLKADKTLGDLGREADLEAAIEKAAKEAADAAGVGSVSGRLRILGFWSNTQPIRRLFRYAVVHREDIARQISGIIFSEDTWGDEDSEGTLLPKVAEKKGVLPGIKIDPGVSGKKDEEKLAKGWEKPGDWPKREAELAETLKGWAAKGAKFTKWRAVITIDTKTKKWPTDENLEHWAQVLARSAKVVQQAGMVPIVEPEVLLDGDHDITAAYLATTRALEALFRAMDEQGVYLPGVILKTSMIVAGKVTEVTPEDKARNERARASARLVGDLTRRALLKTVPANLGGVVFLSGGQGDNEVNENLNEISLARMSSNRNNLQKRMASAELQQELTELDELRSISHGEAASQLERKIAWKTRMLVDLTGRQVGSLDATYSFDRGLQLSGLRAWRQATEAKYGPVKNMKDDEEMIDRYGDEEMMKAAQDGWSKAAEESRAARMGRLHEHRNPGLEKKLDGITGKMMDPKKGILAADTSKGTGEGVEYTSPSREELRLQVLAKDETLGNPGKEKVLEDAIDEAARTAADAKKVGSVTGRLRLLGFFSNTQVIRRLFRLAVVGREDIDKQISAIIFSEDTWGDMDEDGKTPLPLVAERKGPLPGIKIDPGTTPGKDEKMAPGWENPADWPKREEELAESLKGWATKGARFTKWRAVITIDKKKGWPTDANLEHWAQVLARSAKLVQQAGMVPIVEPEVLLDGDHDIDTAYEATTRTLEALFRALDEHGVYLPGVILKTSMIVSGKSNTSRANAKTVGDMTRRALLKTVPANLGGVVFLSGGQGDNEVNDNLNEISRARLSYARHTTQKDAAIAELQAELAILKARFDARRADAEDIMRTIAWKERMLEDLGTRKVGSLDATYSFDRGLQVSGLRAWRKALEAKYESVKQMTDDEMIKRYGEPDMMKAAQDAWSKAADESRAARLGKLRDHRNPGMEKNLKGVATKLMDPQKGILAADTSKGEGSEYIQTKSRQQFREEVLALKPELGDPAKAEELELAIDKAAADEADKAKVGSVSGRLRILGFFSNTQVIRRLFRLAVVGREDIAKQISGIIFSEDTWGDMDDDGVTPLPKVAEKKGVLPGIKIDPGTSGTKEQEKLAKGWEDPTKWPEQEKALAKNLAGWAEKGAKFTKWRAVITIDKKKGWPTNGNLEHWAQVLARSAKIAQQAGLVPIVEPEVLLDGDHDIDTAYAETVKTLEALFQALDEHGVYLPGVILKTSMILSGKSANNRAVAEKVGDMTRRALLKTVPADLGGVVFLSGGQKDDEVNANLNQISLARMTESRHNEQKIAAMAQLKADIAILKAQYTPGGINSENILKTIAWKQRMLIDLEGRKRGSLGTTYSFDRGLQVSGLTAWRGAVEKEYGSVRNMTDDERIKRYSEPEMMKAAQDGWSKAADESRDARRGKYRQPDPQAAKTIVGVEAREAFDSRGNPTVEVVLTLGDGSNVSAKVPSGASTGKHEAMELRDGKAYFKGKGVFNAIKHVNEILAEKVLGLDVSADDIVERLDKIMIDLDGTPNKGRLGANAILGVSLAVSRAAAQARGLELYEYLHEQTARLGVDRPKTLPVPMINMINGGAHVDGVENDGDMQEFMLMPVGFGTFTDAMEASHKVFDALGDILREQGRGPKHDRDYGNEKGYQPQLKDTRDGLNLLMEAMRRAGYEPGKHFVIALDVASSEKQIYNEETGMYRVDGIYRTSDQMVDFYDELKAEYPIASIEDGLAEDDWEGWQKLRARMGHNTQLVGDDFFVTNPERLARGINEKSANSILVKVNQIGTLSESLRVITTALKENWATVVSHRSGETDDTFIMDLAVGSGAMQIKTGGLAEFEGGMERAVKYYRGMAIEAVEGGNAVYAGRYFNVATSRFELPQAARQADRANSPVYGKLWNALTSPAKPFEEWVHAGAAKLVGYEVESIEHGFTGNSSVKIPALKGFPESGKTAFVLAAAPILWLILTAAFGYGVFGMEFGSEPYQAALKVLSAFVFGESAIMLVFHIIGAYAHPDKNDEMNDLYRVRYYLFKKFFKPELPSEVTVGWQGLANSPNSTERVSISNARRDSPNGKVSVLAWHSETSLVNNFLKFRKVEAMPRDERLQGELKAGVLQRLDEDTARILDIVMAGLNDPNAIVTLAVGEPRLYRYAMQMADNVEVEVETPDAARDYVLNQIDRILDGLTRRRYLTPEQLNRLRIAYEPVWAISVAGKTVPPATPQQAWHMGREIKGHLNVKFGKYSGLIDLLYGGSVNAKSVLGYMVAGGKDRIYDGALIGSAATDLAQFPVIAEQLSTLGVREGRLPIFGINWKQIEGDNVKKDAAGAFINIALHHLGANRVQFDFFPEFQVYRDFVAEVEWRLLPWWKKPFALIIGRPKRSDSDRAYSPTSDISAPTGDRSLLTRIEQQSPEAIRMRSEWARAVTNYQQIIETLVLNGSVDQILTTETIDAGDLHKILQNTDLSLEDPEFVTRVSVALQEQVALLKTVDSRKDFNAFAGEAVVLQVVNEMILLRQSQEQASTPTLIAQSRSRLIEGWRQGLERVYSEDRTGKAEAAAKAVPGLIEFLTNAMINSAKPISPVGLIATWVDEKTMTDAYLADLGRLVARQSNVKLALLHDPTINLSELVMKRLASGAAHPKSIQEGLDALYKAMRDRVVAVPAVMDMSNQTVLVQDSLVRAASKLKQDGSNKDDFIAGLTKMNIEFMMPVKPSVSIDFQKLKLVQIILWILGGIQTRISMEQFDELKDNLIQSFA